MPPHQRARRTAHVALLVVALLLGIAVRDGPSWILIRQTIYEPGWDLVEDSQSSTSDALGLTTDASLWGTHAGYALLRPGDPRWDAGGYRAEWHGNDHIAGPGTERWHGISYYFPRDYHQGSNPKTWDDRIIFQFADEGSPMFSLHMDVDSQELWIRRKLPERGPDGLPQFETLGRWRFEQERWYRVVFHAEWTKDSDGVFDVYVDGKPKVQYRGRTLAERSVTYSKWGIYGQPARLLFEDVRIAEGPNAMRAVMERPLSDLRRRLRPARAETTP